MSFSGLQKWKVWLAAVLIFVSGLVVGGVGTAIVIQKVVLQTIKQKPNLSEGRLYKRLNRKLHLSQEQQKEIKEILRETDKKLEAIRKEHRPELRRIYKKTIEDIKPKLDEKQLEKFNKFVSKQEDRWNNN